MTPLAPRAPRFYHETWAIVVAGLLCPPLALYLVVRKPGLSAGARSLVLAAIGAVLVSLALLELFGGLLGLGLARYCAFTLRQRAVFLHRSDRTAEALDHMLRAWALYPADAEMGLDAARLALRLERRTQAASLLTSLARKSSVEDEALLELSRLWMDEPATFDRGRRMIEDAIEQHRVARDDPRALILSARIERSRGDARSAEYLLRQVVLAFRRDLYDHVYSQLAEIALARGDRKLEIAYLCESLRADWDQPRVLARLERAVEALELSWAEYRAHARALELHEDMDAREAARALWERLLARSPGFLHRDGCHYALATSYFYFQRDYRLALEHYRAVITRHPQSESFLRALYQSAQSLEKLGQDEEAARTYRRLADAAPGGSALQRMASAQIMRIKKLGRPGGMPISLPGGET